MKKASLLLLLTLCCSCQWFDKKVPDEEELLQQRLREIDWSKVSSYPSMAECDAIVDKEMRRDCFFETMARIIQQKLDADTIAVLYPEMDTINVEVTVYSDAHLQFEPQFTKDSIPYDRAMIDSIIRNRLVDFPPVQPAQKEGVPVTTKFVIPVILDVNE